MSELVIVIVTIFGSGERMVVISGVVLWLFDWCLVAALAWGSCMYGKRERGWGIRSARQMPVTRRGSREDCE